MPTKEPTKEPTQESTNRNWRFYLDDALECIQKAQLYTSGLDQAAFVASGMNYDATIRNLEILGEAIGKIPPNITQQQPHIPWRFITDFRNRLAHGYFGIDNDIVWDVIENHLPTTEIALLEIKRAEN